MRLKNTELHRTTQMVEKDTIQSITECFFSLTDPSIERSCYERRKSRYKGDWQWRSPFKTVAVKIGEEISKDSIREGLDKCLVEVFAFEAELKHKLNEFE